MFENTGKLKLIPQERIFSTFSGQRMMMDERSLHELARSIEYCGLIEPTVVRRVGSRYELIAGERRYRACVMTGMKKIPCFVVKADDEKAAIMSLSENLQRKNLDCFEVAQNMWEILKKYRMTEEELARRLGKSQTAVKRKLELQKLDKKLIARLRRDGLGEYHARALLRIGNEPLRAEAEKQMAAEGMNASQAVAYAAAIADCAAAEHAPLREKKRSDVIRSVRVFLAGITGAVDQVREAGIAVSVERSEEDKNLVLTVRIPKEIMRHRVKAG